MKIGYIGDTSYRVVIEHANDIALNVTEDCRAAIVEDPSMAGPADLPTINTSPAIRGILSNEELATQFAESFAVGNSYPASQLYGFIGPTGLSDMVELCSDSRFLTGSIGPNLGFVQGTGICVDTDLYLAVPQLQNLTEAVVELGYCGEILIGLAEDYTICDIRFGHFTGGFALFNELMKGNIQDAYEWCLGAKKEPRLHRKGISVVTLLSQPPFPYDLTQRTAIRAPSGADKHMYKVLQGQAEIAYVAAWGIDIFEAKKRVRGTLEKCASYEKDVQYRIDYGYKQKFLLSQDRWLGFGGTD